MLRRKRNNVNISEEEQRNEVADSLKKFRISIDPGELRFNHDLEDPRFSEICDIHEISVLTLNRQPLVIEIHIRELFPLPHPLRNIHRIFPSKFTMQIPRFYPHELPTIYNLELEWNEVSPWSMATQSDDRRISHPLFMEEWDATKGFYDIVLSLIHTLQCVGSSPDAIGATTPTSAPPQIEWPSSQMVLQPSIGSTNQSFSFTESAVEQSSEEHGGFEEDENTGGMMMEVIPTSEW